MDNLSSFLGGVAGVLVLGLFVRLVTLLSILRFGLGLNGRGLGFAFSIVAFVLSLALLEIRGPVQIDPLAMFSGQTIFKSALDEKAMNEFLQKNSDASMQARINQSISKTNETSPLSIKMSIYLLSQLRDAFSAGCLLLIPFVVVDLLVSIAFTSVGVANMSSATLAIPLKLLLFVAIDGWGLLTTRLLGA